MTSQDKQINNVPAWLKPELFESVLKQTIEGYRAIKTFEAVPGTRPGDNYATLMLRIKLEVELEDKTTKPMSYMLKLPHSSAAFDDLLGKSNIFDLERNMFMSYVQEFKELYSKVGLEVEFGARCYKLDVQEDHLLLEDLSLKGFKPTNRQAGLDKEHTLSVLKKLAQWHAASAVRVATIGPYPTNHTKGLFSEENRSLVTAMIVGLLPSVLETLKTIEGSEAYYDDVKNMKENMIEAFLQMSHVDPEEFNVLNHGDCWLSNTMFQYDSQDKLQETYLVDYQMPAYCSVALDLIYFLLSSTKLELKLNNFDYFVKCYRDQLVHHLKLLKYPRKLPSLVDIHTALIKYGFYGYATACGVMTGALLEPTDTAKFENLFSETPEGAAFRTLLFFGKQYREHIKLVMPWLHNRGALQLKYGKK